MDKPARTPSLAPVLHDLAARVRAARHAAGKTQEQAAHDAGMDYKRWQRIEGGVANVTIRTLHRIATACGTTVRALLSPATAAAERVGRYRVRRRRAGGGTGTGARGPAEHGRDR